MSHGCYLPNDLGTDPGQSAVDRDSWTSFLVEKRVANLMAKADALDDTVRCSLSAGFLGERWATATLSVNGEAGAQGSIQRLEPGHPGIEPIRVDRTEWDTLLATAERTVQPGERIREIDVAPHSSGRSYLLEVVRGGFYRARVVHMPYEPTSGADLAALCESLFSLGRTNTPTR